VSFDDIRRRIERQEELDAEGQVRLDDVLDELGADWRAQRGCLSDDDLAEYCYGSRLNPRRLLLWWHIRHCRLCRLDRERFAPVRHRPVILVGLLFPTICCLVLGILIGPHFLQAREKASGKPSSLGNLKQVVTGLLMYAQDYDEVLPPMGNAEEIK